MTEVFSDLAVIFDMDGVLIDSVALNWQAYNQILAEYDVHVPSSELHHYVGRPLVQQLQMLNKRYSLQLATLDFQDKADAIRVELFAKIRPKPGVGTLLRELRKHNVPIAVGSSATAALVKNRLTTAGIYNLFDVVVTQEDVSVHKPHPEVFLAAAEKLGVNPDKCVVIEDAPVGIEAAKNARMKCCAVMTPYISEELLADADLVVASLTTIRAQDLRELVIESRGI